MVLIANGIVLKVERYLVSSTPAQVAHVNERLVRKVCLNAFVEFANGLDSVWKHMSIPTRFHVCVKLD